MNETSKTKFETLLNRVISLEKADKGNIQVYCPASNDLKIVVQSGFEESFLKHFVSVKPFDPSTCGRAFGIGSTVLISDIETDIGYKANKAAAKQAGYRAVKSVPVFDNKQKCIGIVSTHFKEPKWNWETNIIVSVLPEIAAELIAITNIAYQQTE